jgi:serine/threonine protein kinase/DNA-directed RNA polymerase specialized sigma24 family protein
MAPGLPPTEIPDYKLLRKLGGGKFGSVWLGQHRLLGELRAIKLVPANGPLGQIELTGVKNYVQIARDHRHLVPVEHFGEHNGYYYLVMPLADDLKGPAAVRTPEQYEPLTLANYCELHRPLRLDEVLTIARHLLSALEHLHGKGGLVHCDVKPANILRIDGFWRLADMSILIRRNRLAGRRGTPWFIPPEGNVDRRGDLYALGKVLYLLATNHEPAQFPAFLSGALAIPGADDRREKLQKIIQKACAEKPADRYQSADETYKDVYDLVRPTVFELRIDEIFPITPAQQAEILSQIRQRCTSEVSIEGVRPGSVIFTLRLMPDDGERLLSAVREGRLGRFRVLGGWFVEENMPAAQAPARLRHAGHEPAKARPAANPFAATATPPDFVTHPAEGPERRPPADLPEELPGYKIVDVLGRGGMGVVYKAQAPDGSLVAIKTIRHQGLGSEVQRRLLQRLRREASVLEKLSHPNIVRIHGLHALRDEYALVTEHVQGIDLERLVRTAGPLPVAQAAELGRQVAEALRYLHGHGIVHRDLKPSNVMLDRRSGPGRPTVKVLDFGLARVQELTGPTGVSALTGVGELLGTPAYMAPEQLADPHGVDERADLYSLGCTLYYLLTGRLPFGVGPYLRAWDRPPAELPADVPREVAAVVRSLLARRREERPSASELARALEPWGEGVRALAAGVDVPVIALARGPGDDPDLGSTDSALASAVQPDARIRAEALDALMTRCWRPVFYFLRARGYPLHRAEDLTQELFTRFLAEDWPGIVEKSQGELRRYLLEGLKRFLAEQASGRAEGQQTLPESVLSIAGLLKDEDRAYEPPAGESPDDVFRREWAAISLAR